MKFVTQIGLIILCYIVFPIFTIQLLLLLELSF